MSWLDDMLRRRAEYRSRRRTQPKTLGESFWINLIKAFGRALGGKFGRVLAGPKRRRRRDW